MNITLKQLRVFIAIVNHGNMTTAAKAIHMTKGALSQSLSELEHQLNTPIFDRKNTRLYLNDAGQKLIPLADELLNRMAYLENEFSVNPSAPKLKIGCTKSIGAFFLPSLLKKFESQSGWLPEIVIENAHTIQSALNRFELDIALLESSDIDANLDYQLWMKDEMIIVADHQHPLAKIQPKPVSFHQLNQERWILREQNSASRHYFNQQLATHFSEPFQYLSFNAFDTILSCVAEQMGITFISKACLNQPFYRDQLVQIHTTQKFFRNFNIVHHREKYLSVHVLEWLAFLRQQSRNEQTNDHCNGK